MTPRANLPRRAGLIFLPALTLLAAFLSCLPAGRELSRIHAPVRVGTPPDNAFNGLFLLADGELRHYGFEGAWRESVACVYIVSRDHGLTWEQGGSQSTAGEGGGGDNFSALRCRARESTVAGLSPWSGDYIGLTSRRDGAHALRGREGLDGPFETWSTGDHRVDMARPPLFLRSRQRALISGATSISDASGGSTIHPIVYYTDNDGDSWEMSVLKPGPRHEAVWPHQWHRWQNYALEPTVTELSGGRLWMLLRTSMDNLYESFSEDGGLTWTAPAPSRFYSTVTMPTLFRLSDGRLLLFWCNTTPLPEVDRRGDPSVPERIRDMVLDGTWEDVFTNRDAIHAAISEDDGANWIGFRELYLNPLRNEEDFATRGGTEVSLDKSVHQSQAVELPGGKVLVALGQHPLVRSLVVFDPDWLYETKRSDDFSNGLTDWSTFKYYSGIRGHCAYNRDPGPPLVDHPDRPGRKALHLRRPSNPELVCENDGAVWNFPAGLKGRFVTRILLEPGGQGGRVSLIDRWFNPTDLLAGHYAMYDLTFDGDGRIEGGGSLETGRWHEIEFRWEDSRSGECRVTIDGGQASLSLPLNRPSVNGISYVHFQSTATATDNDGFLVESVEAEVYR